MTIATFITTTANQSAPSARPNLNPLAYVQDLKNEGQSWSEGYKTSQGKLYGLLAKCLRAYEQFAASKVAERKAFFKLCERQCGIAQHKKLHLTARIVAFVFGIEGPRVGAYSRVLRIAIEKKISADDFCDWVESRGGIESVRRNRNGKSPAEMRQHKIAQATDALNAVDSLLTINDANGTIKRDVSNPYNFTLALLRHEDANSSVHVVRLSSNKAMIDAFLAMSATDICDESTLKVASTAASAMLAEEIEALNAALAEAKSVTNPAIDFMA